MEENTFLGKFLETIPLYAGFAEEKGKLIFYENGFHISFGDSDFKAPYSYITELENLGAAALGRTKVRLIAYDMFGNRYVLNLALPEISYLKLKRLWEQSE